MKSARFIVVFIILLHVPAISTARSNQLSLSQLLDRCDETLTAYTNIRARCETMKMAVDSKRGDVPLWTKTITELRYDGQRYDMLRHSWFRMPSENDPTPLEKAQNMRQLWDGENFVDHWIYDGNDLSNILRPIFMSKNGDKYGNNIPYCEQAPFLGIMVSDLKPVTEILREADKVRLHDSREIVGDSLCYVIEASGKNGQYTVWLDPEHDYNIAKAKVRKTEGDIAYGLPLGTDEYYEADADEKGKSGFAYPKTLHKIDFGIDNIRFEMVQGRWVPMEADVSYRIKHDSGEVKEERHCSRTLVDLEPDFEAIGAFVANLPNGTVVKLIEVPALNYEWHDGNLVPRIDKFVVESIDYMIDDEKAEVQVEFALQSGEISNTPVTELKKNSSQKADFARASRSRLLLETYWAPVVLVLMGGLLIITNLLCGIFNRLKPKTENGHCKSCRNGSSPA